MVMKFILNIKGVGGISMKFRSILVVFASFFLLTACSNEQAVDKENSEDIGKETVEQEQQEQELTDGVDEEALAEISKKFPQQDAERVITTSVPLAEMLHILGITPVGVPTSNNPLPADFEEIDQIGSPMAPDLEKITSLQSDLLLSSKALESTLEKSVEGMDLNRVYLPTDSIQDLKLSFKAIGRYFHKEDKMNEVLNKITEKEVELEKQAEGKELPSVMLMIGTSDSFMVMSENSYLGSLVDRLGAENIATTQLKVTETYSPINMENIIAADPDIIFVLSSLDHGASHDMFDKEVEKNDAWKKLSAYENGKIHMLDYQIFGVTSINHVEQALTELADYFN